MDRSSDLVEPAYVLPTAQGVAAGVAAAAFSLSRERTT